MNASVFSEGPGGLVPAAAMMLASVAPALAWETPARGSEIRSAMLGAIRSVVARDLNPPVEFVVSELRCDGDLGFGTLQPQRPGGAPISFESTRFPALGMSEEQLDGLTVHVFFERVEGHWYVHDYSIGASDVWWHRSPLCTRFQSVIPEYC